MAACIVKVKVLPFYCSPSKGRRRGKHRGEDQQAHEGVRRTQGNEGGKGGQDQEGEQIEQATTQVQVKEVLASALIFMLLS